MRKRLIAKLEIKSGKVVKPIYFEGLREIGEPSEIAYKYYKDKHELRNGLVIMTYNVLKCMMTKCYIF